MRSRGDYLSLYLSALESRDGGQSPPPDFLHKELATTGISYEDIRSEIADLQLFPPEKLDDGFVEAALAIFEVVGRPANFVQMLCILILDENHCRHEDIALELQSAPDPAAIEPLFKAAQRIYDYAAWDQENAFARKCLFALGAINTDESWNKIALLLTSSVPGVAKWALEQQDRRHR